MHIQDRLIFCQKRHVFCEKRHIFHHKRRIITHHRPMQAEPCILLTSAHQKRPTFYQKRPTFYQKRDDFCVKEIYVSSRETYISHTTRLCTPRLLSFALLSMERDLHSVKRDVYFVERDIQFIMSDVYIDVYFVEKETCVSWKKISTSSRVMYLLHNIGLYLLHCCCSYVAAIGQAQPPVGSIQL